MESSPRMFDWADYSCCTMCNCKKCGRRIKINRVFVKEIKTCQWKILGNDFALPISSPSLDYFTVSFLFTYQVDSFASGFYTILSIIYGSVAIITGLLKFTFYYSSCYL